MSVRKLTTKLTMLLVLVTGGVSASAQDHNHQLADPFAFDPDFQWFEPVYDADILDMKPKKRAHTGWFATYDRLHLYGSRPDNPEDTGDGNRLDYGGGHRYDVGYMRPDADSGMLFTYLENDVTEIDSLYVDRLNRINVNDFQGDPNYPDPNRFGLDVFRDTDGNVIGYSRRFYSVGLTLNSMQMRSYELSKTWRMEPYHYGGILEPMLGARFIQAEDQASLRTYGYTFDDPNLALIGIGTSPYVSIIPNPPGTDATPLDRLNTYSVQIRNDIYALQAGFRYFKFQNRWRYSAEFRGFTGVSSQAYSSRRTEATTVYDSFDEGAEVVLDTTTTSTTQFDSNSEFVIGFDARAELGYQLTKMINVRCGLQVVDIASGVWRSSHNLAEQTGGLVTPSVETGRQDQSYLAFGYTFGIELNR
ncbi:hypothetical protein [Allorhodopirellula solitaria]|uniref:Uncharacterized protein n=1 Tax=Allorhodopirellula solitaria TaxID=2527987 RepID=A0A5C5YDG9_9BACT|nr:hypothetical protein [Allorhodopirellula solitaria]TWT73144.1 hypothetical protein CA85_16110 [Allorhodopirellula solitaria]